MKKSQLRKIIKEELKAVLTEGKKKFRVNPHPIGKAKYSIDFHDGKSTHKDGSPFWGINIFKNKKDLAKAIKDYTKKGYIKEPVNEGFTKLSDEQKTKVKDGVKKGLSPEDVIDQYFDYDDKYLQSVKALMDKITT